MTQKLSTFAAALMALAPSLSALAQSPAQPPAHRSGEHAPPARLSPVVVSAPKEDGYAQNLEEQDLARRRTSTSDSASLLRGIPGVGVYGAGGISSLPAIRGLADERIRTLVDGMDLTAACPNHMNPALSLIDPSRVARVEVFAGITPVSVGGDSIGGTIQVKSVPPKFAGTSEGFLAEGRAGRFHRSNGHADGGNFGFTLAGEFLSIAYDESMSESGNYRAAAGFKRPGLWQAFGVRRRDVPPDEVVASEYQGARNRDLGLAVKAGEHLVSLRVGEQRVGYQGFPNQRMDMVSSAPDPMQPGAYILDKDRSANINRLLNLRYEGHFGWGTLEGHVFQQDAEHRMDLLQDRFLGIFMPMASTARTIGGGLTGSIALSPTDLLRVGVDYQRYRLNDWWNGVGFAPGSMCCNDFWNIRDGKRDRTGIFAEWESEPSPSWVTLLGIRLGFVRSDTGPVQGYSTLAMYANDATRFNARERDRADRHIDITALARYSPDASLTYEAGLARKSRSPSIYERYAWSTSAMAALMNNFVGDGNGYIGNADLEPEVAHILSASALWKDAADKRWDLKVTAHLTHVNDFIDARRCTPSISSQCSTANAATTTSYVLLQYVNQAARLSGIEASGRYVLKKSGTLGELSATGVVNYLRGANQATGDNLYHIMPLETRWSLIHRLGGWTGTMEVQAVREKKRISQVRNEARTPGYALLNLYASYEWKHVRLDLGIENATDKFYLLPLGGAYLGQGNSMTTGGIPWGMTVPGRGRSMNTSLSVRF